jgi:flagellar biosynthesis/type III secretory pathway M-ring protein FliF/YscJ
MTQFSGKTPEKPESNKYRPLAGNPMASFDSETEQDEVQKAKSKLVMDFGLNQSQPERITIEVLKQLIREKPEKISQAVRRWLHPGE